MKVLIKQEGELVIVQAAYHPKLSELFKTFKGYAFNAQNRLFSFRTEDREKLIDGILDLNVSVHEVEQFEPSKEVKRVATFKRTDDTLEVLATYSKEVRIICRQTIFPPSFYNFFLQLVGLFRDFNGRFDGITTRWTLNNDPRILVELEKLGYILRELDKTEFENKHRKTEVGLPNEDICNI